MVIEQKQLRLAGTIALVLALCRSGGADVASKEYQVKAAFIYNFARFIEWPASVFSSGISPFVIGVVGTDPFNGALDQAVAGKLVGSRKVVIKYFTTADDIGSCQILFVATNDEEAQKTIVQKVLHQPVLTLGESETFNADGGCLRFFVESSKMRFEINTDATDQAQLKVSSKVLKLARIFRK